MVDKTIPSTVVPAPAPGEVQAPGSPQAMGGAGPQPLASDGSQPAATTLQPLRLQDPRLAPSVGQPPAARAHLLGPTARPNEHINTGAVTSGMAPLPPDAYTWLRPLMDASSSADAPPQLGILLRAILSKMGQ